MHGLIWIQARSCAIVISQLLSHFHTTLPCPTAVPRVVARRRAGHKNQPGLVQHLQSTALHLLSLFLTTPSLSLSLSLSLYNPLQLLTTHCYTLRIHFLTPSLPHSLTHSLPLSTVNDCLPPTPSLFLQHSYHLHS
ncbi:MAG: hypothetical protein J3Q66DRAFT_122740 [Benniella sp.]|nr:MAG: hypothetical protein J3Q66DRAFT_122740 [Benniella sp.]